MSEGPPVVRLRGAGRRFGSHDALRDVDLTVHAGERIGVLGTSGAGKSTLLALLNGSLRATSGSVEVFGDDLGALPTGRLRHVQRRIGTISQRLDLVEQVRVLHNVNAGRLGRWGSGRALWSLVASRPDAEVRDALHQVGLAWAVHERTERLSGGERQRVAIARLLVQRPDLVLADEPVSSLDPARAGEILAAAAPARRRLDAGGQPAPARARPAALQSGDRVAGRRDHLRRRCGLGGRRPTGRPVRAGMSRESPVERGAG